MNNEWLNLQYLSYALEVYKAGSISKAAENLYMSQPNLSKAIKELETIIGASLFERTTKGVSATTEDGRVFLEYAKNILGQFKDMKSYFQTANPKRNVFRISIPRASYIAEAFASFMNEVEDRDTFYMICQEANSSEAIRSVANDGYNLAIIRYRALYENFFLPLLLEKELEYREILESDSVVIMSAKNKLAGKDILELSDLENMLEIANNDFDIPRQLSAEKIKTEFMPHSRRQILIYEGGSQLKLLAHNANAFMWGSPMPMDTLMNNSLIQKKCNTEDMVFKDVLIYRQQHTFGELEQAFLNSVEQVKESIWFK